MNIKKKKIQVLLAKMKIAFVFIHKYKKNPFFLVRVLPSLDKEKERMDQVVRSSFNYIAYRWPGSLLFLTALHNKYIMS
jgi:hypothetical protein